MTVPLCWLNGYPVFTAHAARKLRQEEDVVGQANARAIRYRSISKNCAVTPSAS